MQGGGGCDHEERSPDTIGLGHVGQEGQGLDGFTETHFISQDTINPLIV